MKIAKALVIISVVLIIAAHAWAEDTQIVTLKDGSQVKGEVVSLSSGMYTIHTSSMGDVKVSASQVASISNSTNTAGQIPQMTTSQGPIDNAYNQQIQSLQGSITNNPALMNDILDLAKDPQLVPLLSDPVLLQKVMSHDVNGLEKDPKAQELMNNPKIRALMEKIKSTSPTQ